MLDYDNLLKDLFINPTYANQTLSWASTDSMDRFAELSESEDQELVDLVADYTEDPVTYEFNSYGYRSPEFDEVEDGNFILVSGCSHTVGIGNRYKDLWWVKLGEQLDMPVVNLAQESYGPDFMFYNTNLWINRKYPTPKIAIYQHPVTNRVMKTFIGNSINMYSDTDDLENENVMHNCAFRHGMYTDALTNMWNALGVPCYHWGFQPDAEVANIFATNCIHQITGGDRARDDTHDGPGAHTNAYEYLLPLCKNDKIQNVYNRPDASLYDFTADSARSGFEEKLADSITELRDATGIIYD